MTTFINDDEGIVFDCKSMTKTEKKIWLMAYTSNQPSPFENPEGFSAKMLKPFHDSVYWACAAVYHFRGITRCPSNTECLSMFEYMRSI